MSRELSLVTVDHRGEAEARRPDQAHHRAGNRGWKTAHDEPAIVGGEVQLDRADPFDRVLLATALVDGLLLATADSALVEAAARDRSLPVCAVT